MTYNAAEISVQSGAPIECYEFSRGPVYYRYTSAATDVTVNSKLFTAKPISRSAIEATPEAARSALTITGPRDLPVADLYRVAPPSDVVTLTVYRYHETDGDGEIATIWTGRVLNARWKPNSTVELMCEPIYTSMARPGLRRLYQRTCPHVLYSAACGALSGAVGLTTTVDAVSGATITITAADAYADGYFSGGYVEWETQTGVYERRMIHNHTAASLALASAIIGLATGTTIHIFPGCDKTLATCNTRFSNADNYGGFPWIPTKNPFGGDPIY